MDIFFCYYYNYSPGYRSHNIASFEIKHHLNLLENRFTLWKIKVNTNKSSRITFLFVLKTIQQSNFSTNIITPN